MERDNNGRWLPGCFSPNPGGRPRGAVRKITAICLASAEDIVRQLIQLALDPNVRPRDRIAAANIVLDRGLGKASPEIPDEDDEPMDRKAKILRLISPELREQLGFNRNKSLPMPKCEND